jgi:hypothetical protein
MGLFPFSLQIGILPSSNAPLGWQIRAVLVGHGRFLAGAACSSRFAKTPCLAAPSRVQ